MSILEKVKKHYGKTLPGKSEFRNDKEAPATLEEVYSEYKLWDTFEKAFYSMKEQDKKPSTPAKTTGATNDKTTK
jgi:hypothetical protein